MPPPELPTATPGSRNPESLQAVAITQVRPTPDKGFEPLSVGPGHIYFVREGKLWLIEPDGREEKKLSNLPITNPPQPSPDGKLLAFTSGKDLYIIPSEGGDARKLASGELADHQRLGWTPDSSLVGYLAYDPSTPGTATAWAASIEDSAANQSKIQNPKSKIIIDGIEAPVSRGPAYESSVQWSPDGNWVLVAGANNPARLLRWPRGGDREDDVREIPGGEPDWSPDSRAIVYAESIHGALSVYYVIASGATPFRTGQQSVGTGMGEYSQGPGPRLSPASSGVDSDPIAYRSRTISGEPQVALRRRGGRELASLPSLTNNPSWSPAGDQIVVETGKIENDPLGLKWVPEGLAVADINRQGEHTLTPLIKNAQWPVWSK